MNETKIYETEIIESNIYTCLMCEKKFYGVTILSKHYAHKHKIKIKQKEYCDLISPTLYTIIKERLKQKIKDICLLKYGATSTLGLPNVKLSREKSLIDNKELIVIKRKLSLTPEKKELAKNKRLHTMQTRYDVDYITQLESIKEKVKTTLLTRYNITCGANIIESNGITKGRNTLFKHYGVYNPSQSEIINIKSKHTFIKNYGYKHYLMSTHRRQLFELKYGWTSKEDWDDFKLYQTTITRDTKKNKTQLFSNWDGKCYYTKQVLNTILNDPLEITIDHKISVVYGFKNNIPNEQISNISNLCLCSRYINSKKNYRTEFQFKDILENILVSL